MAYQGLVVLAVLMAVSQAGWSQDDMTEKKKKKKAQADAAKVAKPRWEYKVVRADELVPKAWTATTTNSVSPDGSATATATNDGPGAIADALNKLGQDGWELVAVDSPARMPAIGGMVGGLGGGGFGGAGFGGRGGGEAGRGEDAARAVSGMADRQWDGMAKGKDVIDLSDPEHKAVRDRLKQRYPDLPADGVLTKEKFKEAVAKRVAASNPTRGGVATFAAAAHGPPPPITSSGPRTDPPARVSAPNNTATP